AVLLAAGMTFLTEITSNLASVNMILPILTEASQPGNLDVDPRVLMIPTVIAASCAFMLPVATPPNAIVYSSGRVTIADMAKAGLVMNLLGIVMVVLFVSLIKV
ncbi:MAG: anion permease, partial [Planctomycetales bacterium]